MLLRVEGSRFMIGCYRVAKISIQAGIAVDESEQQFTPLEHEVRHRRRVEAQAAQNMRRAEMVLDFYSILESGESSWFGFDQLSGVLVLYVPSLLIAIVSMGGAYVAWRTAPRRRESDACQSCGYSLADLPTTTCPECGATITHA
ncbi:MAG: hypothetical protein R3B67_03975 [Phycisphaerales bacterium]